MAILESIDRDFKIDHKQTPKDILTGEKHNFTDANG